MTNYRIPSLNETDMKHLTGATKELFLAVERHDVQACAAFISAGADVAATAAGGQTPAHVAADASADDPLERLTVAAIGLYLAAHGGTEVDVPNEAGMTPIALAARRGNEALVTGLARSGASVVWLNPEDPMGIGRHSSVLHYAMMNDSSGGGLCTICEILLTKGADSNSCNELGRTPLHILAWYVGHVLPDLNVDAEQAEEWRYAVSVLVEYGADPAEPDGNNDTPLDILMQGKNQDNAAALSVRDRVRKALLESDTTSLKERGSRPQPQGDLEMAP